MSKNFNYIEKIIFKFSRFFLMMKEGDHDGKGVKWLIASKVIHIIFC